MSGVLPPEATRYHVHLLQGDGATSSTDQLGPFLHTDSVPDDQEVREEIEIDRVLVGAVVLAVCLEHRDEGVVTSARNPCSIGSGPLRWPRRLFPRRASGYGPPSRTRNLAVCCGAVPAPGWC